MRVNFNLNLQNAHGRLLATLVSVSSYLRIKEVFNKEFSHEFNELLTRVYCRAYGLAELANSPSTPASLVILRDFYSQNKTKIDDFFNEAIKRNEKRMMEVAESAFNRDINPYITESMMGAMRQHHEENGCILPSLYRDLRSSIRADASLYEGFNNVPKVKNASAIDKLGSTLEGMEILMMCSLENISDYDDILMVKSANEKFRELATGQCCTSLRLRYYDWGDVNGSYIDSFIKYILRRNGSDGFDPASGQSASTVPYELRYAVKLLPW